MVGDVNKMSVAETEIQWNRIGCISAVQEKLVREALGDYDRNPSLLCDLEACGPVAELEKQFAELCGADYALALSSGTAAIHTALLAAGIGAGDEVIVTSYSWSQSVSPVLFCGATPVFADIDPSTCNIDPVSVVGLVTGKTKAIIVVHLYGHPADLCKLQRIASERNIILISDAAHALGAKLFDQPVASYGDVTCFSLSRGKLISAGEGGILATNDQEFYRRAVMLSQHHERVCRLEHGVQPVEGLGLNYRLHPLVALLALGSMQEYEKRLAHRQAVMAAFVEGLDEQEEISLLRSLPGELPASYGIPLTFNNSEGREVLVEKAQQQGIPLRCGPVVKPIHLRLDKDSFRYITPHFSWQKGSCLQSEKRCSSQELWALSALDMDGIAPSKAAEFGCIIGKLSLR